MPYKIVKQKDQYCVQNTDTGENKGCSDTEDMAKQHMAAMYANEKKPGKKAFQSLIAQDECNYIPLSTTRGKACANCRWFVAEENECYICDDEPEPILATGYCDRWEATPVPAQPEQAPIPVTIVEPPDMGEMEMALPKKALNYVIDGLSEFLRPMVEAVQKGVDANTVEPAFSVWKARDGKRYWLARHTGKWVDRESEIITDKAHEDYVTRVQSGKVPLPELWVWHKKGTRHGQADMVWKSGGFVLALGHFDDTPEADKAYKFYEKNRGKIKLSHMFTYPKRAKQGRVFHAYNTVEITTLPDGAEAFPYTSFEELTPMLTDSQKEQILNTLGEEGLKRVLAADSKADADSKTLDDNGVSSKNLNNFEGSELPTDKDIEALKTRADELETKLKSVEAVPGQVEAMGMMIKAQNDLIAEMQKTLDNTLAKNNRLEKQLLEYQAVAPRASKSQDTLLNEREKSVIELAMREAKASNTPSLVEMALGSHPAITEQ